MYINSVNDFTKYRNKKGCDTVFSYYIVKPYYYIIKYFQLFPNIVSNILVNIIDNDKKYYKNKSLKFILYEMV
jgi:hypothetical protein